MTVSLALLVKDPPLDRLAALVDLASSVCSDVVIAVDDRTDPNAQRVMAAWPNTTLVPISWADDFAAARNAALPACRGDWTLVLDPDELPSVAMLDFVRRVDDMPALPAMGYLFWTRNYWSGELGPEMEYHWHVRLFRTGRGRFYRPIHELVELDPLGSGLWLPENDTRETPLCPKAPLHAHLIHSKGAAAIARDDAAYAAMGEASR